MTDVGQAAGKCDRVLDEAELGQLWKAIFVESDIKFMSEYARKMFVLCTVFGCRMSEARLSEWKEWDLKNWVWSVPKEHSKNWGGNCKASTRSSDAVDNGRLRGNKTFRLCAG